MEPSSLTFLGARTRRTRERFRTQDLVELLLAEQSLFQHQDIDALARRVSLLGNLRRIDVADVRIEGRDDADRVLDGAAQVLAVRAYAGDAAEAKRIAAVAHVRDALEQAV